MKIKKINFKFTICKLKSELDININNDFYFIGKTSDEISLVCKTQDIPQNVIERDDDWNGFYIDGILDFSLIGILSEISSILAKNKIGIFAISTFNTDYILVKSENFEKSLIVLKNSGYEIE